MSSVLEDAEAELSAAEGDLVRLRTQNQALAEEFRHDPTDHAKEGLRRAAASLSSAKDRVETARARVELAKKTGSAYGLMAQGGRVLGAIAVTLSPGISKADRIRLATAERVLVVDERERGRFSLVILDRQLPHTRRPRGTPRRRATL